MTYERFVAAQAETYDDAIDILRRGVMCTPYMDFIFPRLARGTVDERLCARLAGRGERLSGLSA